MARLSEIRVSDMMKPAVTAGRDMTIHDFLHILVSKKADFLSVVDDHHKLIGALSESNLIKIVKHQPSSLIGDPVWFDEIDHAKGKEHVEKIMTTQITTVKPEENIGTAIKIMNSVGYRMVNVVDHEGKLLGIVTLKDIFEKLLGGPHGTTA